MDEINTMLAVLVVGFIFLMVGFSRREHEWGIAVLGIGGVIMLGTIGYRIYLGLQL
ncbi:hypothetical protein [Pseudomonas sp. 5P_3.1_Bac2]|uniref:hypothetical protein n=1 Tax=Pseudomonas sp. 5P_3.1_Bac2 TaxID=2971617 RepID=UPI0021C5F8D7|nr:hypothetical protein [Pseudomonas sp. 5P_3.1_Bac2]MCU1719172.1 hypothetical protein [Pseudomonas sp. 5P_3.1_Bac2]